MRKLLARLAAWAVGKVASAEEDVHIAENAIEVWSEKQLSQLRNLEFSLNRVLDNFEARLIALERRLDPATAEQVAAVEQPSAEPPAGAAQ